MANSPDLPPGFVPADAPSPEEAKAFIVAEAQRQGVDPDIALRIANTESSLDHSQVSPKGAIGLMQLLKGTASDMGVDPLDWKDNVRGGVKYYKTMLAKFGTPQLAAAAYNAGPGTVMKAGGIPDNPETQAYVQKVAGAPAVVAAPAPAPAPAPTRVAEVPEGFEPIDAAGHTDANIEGTLKAGASGFATGAIGGSVGMPGAYGDYVKSQRDPEFPFLATAANRSPADSVAMLAPNTQQITHALGLDYTPQNNVERYTKAALTGAGSMPGGALSRAVMAVAGAGGEAATQLNGHDGTPDETFRPQGLALGTSLPAAKAASFKTASLVKDFGGAIMDLVKKRAPAAEPALVGTLNRPDQLQKVANVARSFTVQNQNPPSKEPITGPDAGDMMSQIVDYLRKNNRGSLLGKMLQ